MGYVIPDSPHTAKWLSRREAVVVMSRKRHDHHTVEKRQLRWDQVAEWARDPKTYLYFLLGFFANVPNGATSNCKLDSANKSTSLISSRHAGYQRLWVQHFQDDIVADPVRVFHCYHDVS